MPLLPWAHVPLTVKAQGQVPLRVHPVLQAPWQGRTWNDNGGPERFPSESPSLRYYYNFTQRFVCCICFQGKLFFPCQFFQNTLYSCVTLSIFGLTSTLHIFDSVLWSRRFLRANTGPIRTYGEPGVPWLPCGRRLFLHRENPRPDLSDGRGMRRGNQWRQESPLATLLLKVSY